MSTLASARAKPNIEDYSLDELLAMAAERQASDVHLTTNLPPMLRIDGHLRPMNFDRLESRECQRLIYSILTDHQIGDFEEKHELDFSHRACSCRPGPAGAQALECPDQSDR